MTIVHALLVGFARLTSTRPRLVIGAIVALTVVLASFAGNQSTDTELSAFAVDSDLTAALERVQRDFAAGGASLEVVVDAGPGGDVLSRAGLEAALAVDDAVAGARIDLDGGDLVVQSFAAGVVADLEEQGVALDDATEAQIDAAASDALRNGVGRLMSTDAAADAGTARAGLVVVSFPAVMTDSAVVQASLDLAAAVEEIDAGAISVSPFNDVVLGDALQQQSEEEMSRLLSLALVLIVLILFVQYRTLSDVVIGFVGLLITITWLMGFGVLLGPDHLSLIGPFSQMTMIVPVLLVGLGIDYAIHLTSRYREEQTHGLTPPRAAATAVRTVGGALVLATVTTMVGFLTNVFSPLPPIADFGVLTAVGVLGAFVVMATFVPAARNVLDTRRAARGTLPDRPHRPASGLSAVMGRTAVIAQRAPRFALAVALVVSLSATAAATQVSTTFSQEDFIPADSEIGRLIDRIEALFGGGIAETTFVLLDGDLTAPAAAQAQLALGEGLAGISDVRTDAGAAQLSSPAALIATVVADDPSLVDSAAQLGFTLEDGFAADADVVGLYQLARSADPARATQVLDADATSGVVAIATSAGQDGAEALAAAIDAELEEVRAAGLTTTITSGPLINEESLRALTASQTRGIVITLVAALALLMAYFGIKERKAVLGAITMVPSIAVVTWVLGTMWLVGISFNMLTAMVASLGIGIGVPFGIHVTHRFLEDRRRYDTIDEALSHTVTHTGGAMAGSAATTVTGFGVLVFAALTPMRQFGIIVAITIFYSFVAAVLVQPSCLKLWGEWRARRGDTVDLHDHEVRDATIAAGEDDPVAELV